ncbi:MAG: hypothetical protein ABEK36_06095 [Candidatus Aenigmatarchaeota archaeon]
MKNIEYESDKLEEDGDQGEESLGLRDYFLSLKNPKIQYDIPAAVFTACSSVTTGALATMDKPLYLGLAATTLAMETGYWAGRYKGYKKWKKRKQE